MQNKLIIIIKEKRQQLVLAIILLTSLLIGISYKNGQNNAYKIVERYTQEVPPTSYNKNNITTKLITVHLSGEIINPGLYQVAQGTKTHQLIKLAGGATSAANLQKINLAKILKDGQKINLSSSKKLKQKKRTNTTLLSKSHIININTANSKNLQRLLGVGPQLAKRILEYRTINGPFKSKGDIKKVKGIGKKLLQKNLTLIKL
jgi:competence protein ComEA